MRRRAAVLALAGVAVLGVAACGDRTGAGAAPASSPTSTSSAAPDAGGADGEVRDVGEAQLAGVASAVEDAEALLRSIDAELAEDDDEGVGGGAGGTDR